jgi:tetratricopeptide (TPR) repeat protein
MKKKIILVLLFVIVKVEAQTSTFAVSDSLFAKGRYQLALKHLEKMTQSFETNLKMAVIYESIDDDKKAANSLEKALTFKNDFNTKWKLAKAYQRIEKPTLAVPIYEELVAKDSLNLLIQYQLGKLYLTTKKTEKAIETFSQLIKNDNSNANYSYHLASAYALKNDRDRMINSFIDTFKKDTLHLKAIAHLASSFAKLGDLDSTMLFVDKGLMLDKNHINLNRIKINQLFRDKKYMETLPLLLNLDTIDKSDTYSLSLLGKVYFNLDSLDKAKKYFQKLSNVDKEDFKANTYLGHIAFKEKDYRIATMNYMFATRKGKKSRDEEFYGLGSVFFETEKPRDAMDSFENAYKENPRNYRALYQWAKLSDDFYKDKKTAYKLYVRYIDNFRDTDTVISDFVNRRIQDIKKEYFMKGETLD